MTYTVEVKIMPLKNLLDPQGKAVMGGLQNLGINNELSTHKIDKHLRISLTKKKLKKQLIHPKNIFINSDIDKLVFYKI